MKSSKILTVLISFLLGVIAAMAYQESQNHEKNALEQAMEEVQKAQEE